MKHWRVKIQLNGVDANINVVAKNKVQARERAIAYAKEIGYTVGSILNTKQVKY